MLSAALLLFANTLLFSLRLSGGGSFPKPLSAAETHEKGKDVPENAGGAAQRKSERAFREDINRQPRCEKGFENVENSGEKADAFSHRYDGVGSAGVH